MRIAFINTADIKGGAAVITQRLMKYLSLRYATENYLLVKTKTGVSANTEQILTNRPEIIIEKIIDRVSRPIGMLYQFFPFSSASLLNSIKSFKPDIINLHNTHGAYFAISMLEKLSKIAPVAWTLHDMWSFTGNASHTFGNMSWKHLKNDPVLKKIPPSIGINTGSWLLRQKKRIYQNANLTIITPSEWLRILAMQSPVFEGKKIHQIYNGIDPTIFFQQPKSIAKQKLNLVNNCKTIMFSSHFLDKNNPWKGGMDLLNILGKINSITNEKINLLILGEGKPAELDNFSNFNLFYKGYVEEEEILNDCLNAADLFIYPTRADNLPNVLIESIACGTPCITFDIGGNNEIIQHGFNGIIIEPFRFDDFAASTLELLRNEAQLSVFSANCTDLTKRRFVINTMIDQYYSVFQQMLEENN
jgi:glycosyltransferase involved in cell wall biosynthesis